jgi:hypothetical protein
LIVNGSGDDFLAAAAQEIALACENED